jgi:hypothetical protein
MLDVRPERACFGGEGVRTGAVIDIESGVRRDRIAVIVDIGLLKLENGYGIVLDKILPKLTAPKAR